MDKIKKKVVNIFWRVVQFFFSNFSWHDDFIHLLRPGNDQDKKNLHTSSYQRKDTRVMRINVSNTKGDLSLFIIKFFQQNYKNSVEKSKILCVDIRAIGVKPKIKFSRNVSTACDVLAFHYFFCSFCVFVAECHYL